MINIHKTAIVSPKARLADGVSVGFFSVIGDGVVIGADTVVGAHCLIEGNTTIGKASEIATGVVLGSKPQDLKYKGERTYLEIGDNNIIREYSTFNLGTGENGKTVVGNNNLFMAYSHIAHDCQVGSHCVIANCGTLAGHVSVEDKVVIGGLAAVHQFNRIGTLSIIGGCSKVIQDIPPYSTCDGHPASIYGLNLLGLRRAGIDAKSLQALSHAFKILFNSGLLLKNAVEQLKQERPQCREVLYLLDFIIKSQRGVSRCRRTGS